MDACSDDPSSPHAWKPRRKRRKKEKKILFFAPFLSRKKEPEGRLFVPPARNCKNPTFVNILYFFCAEVSRVNNVNEDATFLSAPKGRTRFATSSNLSSLSRFARRQSCASGFVKMSAELPAPKSSSSRQQYKRPRGGLHLIADEAVHF